MRRAHHHTNRAAVATAKMLERRARRIAANMAKLPELLARKSKGPA
jgi:hypothetical protein